MKKRAFSAGVLAFLFFAVPTAQAVYYYENTHITSQSSRNYPTYVYPQYSYPSYNYTYPRYTSYPSYYYNDDDDDTGNCLYRNSSGECMIEQYYDRSNYNANNRYYRVYDQDDLYEECRNSGRYSDDDDYYCSYYDDDDYYEDDDYSSVDDDDFYDDDDSHYDYDDDEFDWDAFFDDDDDSDDDDDDDF